MDKPDVDFIEGLSPAVSIDQKSTNRNPRSTVGTITEVYDYLRLLYARAGTPHCPVCGERIARQTPQQIVDQVLAMDEGIRFQVLAPVVRTRKGEFVDLFDKLNSQGYSRVRVDGVVHPLTEPPKLKKQEKHDIEVVVDRLTVKATAKQRLTDSVETALNLADGIVVLEFVDRRRRPPASRAAVLREAGLPQRPPTGRRRPRAAVVLVQLAVRRLPGMQRPGHPQGGRPRTGGARPRPDARRGRRGPVGDGPHRRVLHPHDWPGSASRWASTSTPRGASFRSRRARRFWKGCDEQVHVRYQNRYGRTRSYYADFEGVMAFLQRRMEQTDSEQMKERYDGFMRDVPCPVCDGTRLKPEILAVTLAAGERGTKSIAEVCELSIADCSEFLNDADARPARAGDRRPGAQGGAVPAGLPARRRAGLLVAVPRGRHAVRR